MTVKDVRGQRFRSFLLQASEDLPWFEASKSSSSGNRGFSDGFDGASQGFLWQDVLMSKSMGQSMMVKIT